MLSKINYKYYAIHSFSAFINKKNKKKLILKSSGFRCFLSDDKSALNSKIGFSFIISLIIPNKILVISIDKIFLILEK